MRRSTTRRERPRTASSFSRANRRRVRNRTLLNASNARCLTSIAAAAHFGQSLPHRVAPCDVLTVVSCRDAQGSHAHACHPERGGRASMGRRRSVRVERCQAIHAAVRGVRRSATLQCAVREGLAEGSCSPLASLMSLFVFPVSRCTKFRRLSTRFETTAYVSILKSGLFLPPPSGCTRARVTCDCCASHEQFACCFSLFPVVPGGVHRAAREL